MSGILPIEEVRERDIDLLLLEEFIACESFRQFFVDLLKLPGIKTFLGAYHSLTQGGRGESDLVFHYESISGVVLLILIENKIDASFMDRQAERYRERGAVYKSEKACDDFATVLIAPQSYLKSDQGFDLNLSYETIKSWYEKQNTSRAAYKALLLETAIERRRRGYQRIKNDELTSFQHQFYRLSESMYPELCFRKPVENVPKGSGFMYCEPPALKKNKIEIVHKFFAKENFNAVDLQLKGRASDYAEFEHQYASKLESGMEIVRAGKSLAIRFKLPRLDTNGSFEAQKDSLLLSIGYAKRLYDWCVLNILN